MEVQSITSAYRAHLDRANSLFERAESEYMQYLHNASEVTLGFDQNPLPMWVKSWPSLVMIAVNQGYRDTIGKDQIEYVGRKDHDVWDSETAEHFEKADRVVGETRKTVLLDESWVSNGKKYTAKVIKYPVFGPNGTLIAVGGTVVSPEIMDEIVNGDQDGR